MRNVLIAISLLIALAAVGFAQPTITNPGPAANPTQLPNGTTGVPYSFQFTATGGSPFSGGTYHWTSGTLPTGLSIDFNTGLISGTPSQAGTFQPFTVVATDAAN